MGNNSFAKMSGVSNQSRTEQGSVSFKVLFLEMKCIECKRALHSGKDSVDTYYYMYATLMKEGCNQ